jgi:dienelactone hydrolase
MNIIIVSDVFGITAALLKLKDEIGANTIIDPYKGECMDFENEDEAYSCFMNDVGLDNYASEVFKNTESLNCETILIGFSIGASVIWKSSVKNESNYIQQAFCFYGSQIRNAIEIEPCFKINLVFPKSELHFDVTELIKNLETKPNVKISQVDYLHGFMNYHSSNFNHVGYKEHITLLRSTAS